MARNMRLKKIILVLFLGAFLLAQSPGVVLAAAVSVIGNAKVLNTENSYLDFTNYNSNVTIDNADGKFSGYAFLKDVGWVDFGTQNNPSGPVTLSLITGAVTGKAYVLNTGAYLDFTNYSSNVTANIATGVLTGYVFSEDVGWLVFTTAPSISLTALSPDPNSDNTPTLSGTATQSVGTVSNVQFQMDSTSGSWTNCSASDGSFNSASEAFTCTSSALSDGPHTMYVRATDSNGNTTTNANVSTDTFTIDATAPTGSISINSGATYTNSRSVTLTLSATDNQDSGTSLSMMISNDSEFSGASWETYATSKSWTLSSGDGTQTTYVEYKDSSGNTGSTYSDTIILDTTAPTAPTLTSPSDGTYTNNTSPTFTFSGGSTDATSGFDHYTASISKSSACASGQTCSYSFGTVTAASGFSMGTLAKSLTEGTWSWNVTAYDVAGNTTSTSRTLYVDLSSPSLTATLDNQGQGSDDYYLVNTQSPKISGTVTDNMYISGVTVSFYKEKTLLGVVFSEDLVDQETLGKPTGTTSTTWDYSFTTSKQLDHGKYRVTIKATDAAGNSSSSKEWETQILPQDKINLLLLEAGEKPEKETAGPFSIPELEKKAIVRREMEAANLAQLTSQITDFLSKYFGIPMTEFFGDLSTRIAYFTKTVRGNLAAIQIPSYKFQMPSIKIPTIAKLPNINTSAIAQKSNQMAEVFNKPFNNLAKSSGQVVRRGTKSLALAIIGTGKSISNLNSNMINTYGDQQKKMGDKVASIWQGQKLSEAVDLNLKQLKNPVVKVGNFFTKVKLLYDTDIAIMFDKEPTKISGVTIEEVGHDYAIVSFKTNHPAWGKVNYGESLSYGEEVSLPERTYDHKAKLTGLTPGNKYFFEVMAQNKNYAYDAYYVIEIPK